MNSDLPGYSLTPLHLGADLDASLYKGVGPDGALYFIKKKRGHNEYALLSFLQASAVHQIIAPLKTVHTADSTITVYPFIDAQNGFCQSLTDDQWITLGKVMRQIHDLALPELLKKSIRKEHFESASRHALQALTLPNERAIIDQLIQRADYLRQKVKDEPFEPVLCHSDIHAGNVLIDKEGKIYIIDWDEPIMAPKERDLMFIGAGVANVWNRPEEEKLFYTGYGPTNINPLLIAYYRHERILQDIIELETIPSEEHQKHYTDLFAPNGVVEIALKTDF